MEYTVISHAKGTLVVLVWLTLADAVRKLPGVALLAVWLGHSRLLWFLDCFMEANIDKAFLLEKGFVDVRAHFFGARFDTKACFGLDQDASGWELASLRKLI